MDDVIAVTSLSSEENRMIGQTPTSVLLKRAIINMHQVRSVLNAKRALHDMEKESKCLPDLKESHDMMFQYRGTDSSQAPTLRTRVTIQGHPGNTDIQKKHYYIYSTYGGYGKTYEKDAFVSKYNACNVSDVRNWASVRQTAQFLCFDDVGPTCKIPYRDLKSLTDGDSSGFAGNRKCCGKSRKPRADVQVIMFSNLSPYQVYGKWDRSEGKYLMSAHMFQQFMERFHVYRLDGDDGEMVIRHVHPQAWSLSTCQLCKMHSLRR